VAEHELPGSAKCGEFSHYRVGPCGKNTVFGIHLTEHIALPSWKILHNLLLPSNNGQLCLPKMTTHANLTFNDALGIIYTAADGSTVQYSGGDISWTITASALVLFMSYGVGFFIPAFYGVQMLFLLNL
jgi:hypothetical protein